MADYSGLVARAMRAARGLPLAGNENVLTPATLAGLIERAAARDPELGRFAVRPSESLSTPFVQRSLQNAQRRSDEGLSGLTSSLPPEATSEDILRAVMRRQLIKPVEGVTSLSATAADNWATAVSRADRLFPELGLRKMDPINALDSFEHHVQFTPSVNKDPATLGAARTVWAELEKAFKTQQRMKPTEGQ